MKEEGVEGRLKKGVEARKGGKGEDGNVRGGRRGQEDEEGGKRKKGGRKGGWRRRE